MKIKLPLVTLLLVLINGCLAAVLGWRLFEGSQRTTLTVIEAAEPDVSFGAIDVPVAAVFDSIQARAIFHKSRSFYVAPPPQADVLPPPEYRLVGSMSIPGQQSAVLMHQSGGTRTRVSIGDVIAGWTVAAIEPTRVTMQSGERSVEITSAAHTQGGGVTIVGASAPTSSPAAANGVRVLGNSPAPY